MRHLLKSFYILMALVLIAAPYAYYQTAKADIYGSSLVGWWTLDSNDISGTSVTDKSGSGNTGTTQNSPPKIVGKLGQALSFDGSTQYISLGNPSSLQITGNITVAIWVKLKATTLDVGQSLVAKDSDVGGRGYTMDFFQATNNAWHGFRFYINGGSGTPGNAGNIVAAPTVPTLGVWYNVAATYNTNGTMLLYINGRQVDSSTGNLASIPSATANVDIARREYSGFLDYTNGSIDDVRIYNRTLSAAEVAQLYNLSAPKHRSVF